MVKALDVVMKVIGAVLRVLLIFTVCLIILQVGCRYLLHRPQTWTEQLARYCFIWMMMLGIPVLFHNKSFMAFDLILNSLPNKVRGVTRIFIDVGIVLFAIFWLVGAVNLCAGTMNKMTSGVRIHYYWLYGAQAVAAVLICWEMLTQMVQDVMILIEGAPATDSDRLPAKEDE